MMKKLLFAAALLAALPWGAAAQVEKRVEVTKAYVPSVESAVKLAVEPDRTDTVKLRPEIDYTITPLSLRTTLATRPIRPATVTYWEFNRPLPFYLKAGAGYPAGSVLDFYAATQNPSTGYVLGYVNHAGRYADLRNAFGTKATAWRMRNRIGAAAGKYLGKHILEGEVSYDHRIYHRYGVFSGPDELYPYRPGSRVMFGDADVALRLGDDFRDLSRVNFEVTLRGGLFSADPEVYAFDRPGEGEDPAAGSGSRKRAAESRQTSLGASARIARAFGRHRFSIDAEYGYVSGGKIVKDYGLHRIRAGVRYGVDGGVVRFEAGADFYRDKVKDADAGNYLIPFLRMDFNLGTAGLKPFLEIDGGVWENSFRTLVRMNPYVANGRWEAKSSVNYDGRFGIGGSLWRNRFTYRAYAGFSIRDNRLYWYAADEYGADGIPLIGAGAFLTEPGRQTVTSINGEAEFRPVQQLLLSLGMHGYLYNDEAEIGFAGRTDERFALKNGAPSFEGDAGIRYEGRKIAFGVRVLLTSERSWTTGYARVAEETSFRAVTFTAPFAADLRVNFDWKVSHRVTLFAEGYNLADRPLYRYPLYREYGAGFTLGVKANF